MVIFSGVQSELAKPLPILRAWLYYLQCFLELCSFMYWMGSLVWKLKCAFWWKLDTIPFLQRPSIDLLL